MAKSIRSKWKRKCRAVKRQRYNKKELERLKKTLSNDPCNKLADVEILDISQIATVVDKSTISKSKNSIMEVKEDGEKARVFNPRTLKDQNGTYPIWVHPRKIHKRRKTRKEKSKRK